MGRKNRNVRHRNTPRAAQRQPKNQRTPSAQSDARQHWDDKHSPLGSSGPKPANRLSTGDPAQLGYE